MANSDLKANSDTRFATENPGEAGVFHRTAAVASHDPELHKRPVYTSLFGQSVFWRPRYVVQSPLLETLPYLFWLMETIRPVKVVQIGLKDGLIFMALCQAAERLGVQGEVLGIGLESENPTLETRQTRFLAQHQSAYSHFSRCLSASDALAHSEDLRADLLVLHAPIDAAETDELVQACLERLSRRGVILLCQTDVSQGDGAKLRARLISRGRGGIVGPSSPGRGKLDVILDGESQPERLLSLCEETGEESLRMIARQFFGILGEGLSAVAEADALREAKALGLRAFEQAQDEIGQLQVALAESQERAAQNNEQLLQAHQDVAELTRRHNGDVYRLEALQMKVEEARQSLAVAPATLSLVTGPDKGMQDQLAREMAQVQALMAENKAMAEQLAKAQTDKTKLESELVKAREATRRAGDQAKLLKQRIDALIHSTSWRITRPMRSIKDFVTRSGVKGDQ